MGEIAVPGIFELNPGAVQEFTLNCAGVVYEELGFGEGPIVKSGTRIVSVTCPDVIRELEAVARVGALNRGWRVELAVERLGEFGLDERLARWLLGRSKPPRTFPVRAPGRKRDEDVYVLGVLRKGEEFRPGKALFRYGSPDQLIVSCQLPAEVVRCVAPGDHAIVTLLDWGRRSVSARVADVAHAPRHSELRTLYLVLTSGMPAGMPASTRLEILINAPGLPQDYKPAAAVPVVGEAPSRRHDGLLTRGRAGGHETLHARELREKAEKARLTALQPAVGDEIPLPAVAELAPFEPSFASRLRKSAPFATFNRRQWKAMKLQTVLVGHFRKVPRHPCAAVLSWVAAPAKSSTASFPDDGRDHSFFPLPILKPFPEATGSAQLTARSENARPVLSCELPEPAFEQVWGSRILCVAVRLNAGGETGIFEVSVESCTIVRTRGSVRLSIPLPTTPQVTGEAGTRSVLLWDPDRAQERFIVPRTAVVTDSSETVLFVHSGRGNLARAVVSDPQVLDTDRYHLSGPDLRGERVVFDPRRISSKNNA